MIRRLFGIVMAIGLLTTVPTGAAAQDDPASLEGIDWALSTYLGDGDFDPGPVPIGVMPTLRLEGGTASGEGGCNSFNGEYRLRDNTIAFSDELSRTLKFCEDATQDVEDAFLSLLPLVASWAIVDGGLEFYDEFDDVVLTFAEGGAGLTPGQVAALIARIDDLEAAIAAVDQRVSDVDQRVDNVNVQRLRQRINALEAETARLRRLLNSRPSATPRPTNPPPRIGFNKAEEVLLSGIPRRIASRCEPWRDLLPSGTAAAVRCKPNTTTTSDLKYYLMDLGSATDVFEREMGSRGVPEARTGNERCGNDVRSWTYTGFGVGEGCDRDPGPRVYVAFVTPIPGCPSIGVGGKRVNSPAYFIELQGNGDSMKRTYDWATKGSDGGLSIAGSNPFC